jgi:hypothetical protein
MCWGKLSRHPGRAHAWPLCGPWPRPHLAASKLVELRSSVNLVAMPYQPLDRPVASLTNPGLRDVRCAHIAPTLRLACCAFFGTGSAVQGSLSQWHEEASAWGSSPSRLCVLGRSLSHANDQESHPLPDPAAARRCGGFGQRYCNRTRIGTIHSNGFKRPTKTVGCNRKANRNCFC